MTLHLVSITARNGTPAAALTRALALHTQPAPLQVRERQPDAKRAG